MLMAPTVSAISQDGNCRMIHNGGADSAVDAKALPFHYHFCDLQDLVHMISGVVEEAIYENDEKDLPQLSMALTPFHSL